MGKGQAAANAWTALGIVRASRVSSALRVARGCSWLSGKDGGEILFTGSIHFARSSFQADWIDKQVNERCAMKERDDLRRRSNVIKTTFEAPVVSRMTFPACKKIDLSTQCVVCHMAARRIKSSMLRSQDD